MHKRSFQNQSHRVDRRRFLVSATTLAWIGVAINQQTEAAASELVGIRQPEHPRSKIDSWHVGLITAYRPGFTPTEIRARNAQLRIEINRYGFGVLHLRGCYIEGYGLPCARRVEEHAYLVFGNADDSGGLSAKIWKESMTSPAKSIRATTGDTDLAPSE